MSAIGKLITLEGGEGVGKSTNAIFIRDYLQAQGLSVVLTREPGGTQLGEKIRALLLAPEEKIHPLSELLLMFAARAPHIEDVIKPALQQGAWVICDRFVDASYAYQGGGRGLAFDTISAIEKTILQDFKADLTLLFDADPAQLTSRLTERGIAKDRFEREAVDFFQRVREAYLARAASDPVRYRIVDAAQNLNIVQKELQTHLQQFISSASL
ncbi:MAG: dTMP kinase [Gammaproteobacteria bacterium]|nr:dTMP kinase [Gammaproteobacteria bacterium]